MIEVDENTVPETNVNTKKGGKKTIEQIYQKKTQLEHILLRPDTYVGSVEPQTQPTWVYDSENNEIVQRSITFTPGLYKIFDEIIVNAADNKQRDPNMDTLKVTINAEENTISVWNNGCGVPVAMHAEHDCYVPELIFGNLLTGSNFDDGQAKTTGGRNGYGAKLANIFSTEFIVETADSERGLKYKQVFKNNMSEKGKPEVKSYNTGKDYTCITFKPDLERFNMTKLDKDTVDLLSKRAFDIAGTTITTGATKQPKLKVYLNNKKCDINNFQKYISMYKGFEPPVAYEIVGDRWQVGVGVSDGSFNQISYVNSIATTKGGMHVNYIADQVTQRLVTAIKKKNKGSEVKASNIKNHIVVYVNALVVNPAFDSQTKENLTTKISAFGSKCELSDKFHKAIEKSAVVENVLNWAKFKQTSELKKKGGSKRSKLLGITKLDDANNAGTSKSKDCTLILTEGDSAKALAISGLGVVGRDNYGVFPLKGKLLNVREASHAQIMKNEEIQNIAKIMGLTFGKTYEDTSSLRYGHLMIMTDQDHDGSHIKGLLINFLHHFWPSLLSIPGFLLQFITPIVKCTKGKKEITFFTLPEYHEWCEEQDNMKSWKIKYYKGLGTSTAAEAKEYFSHLETHKIDFEWDTNAGDVIELAFAKKRVEDRKGWLLNMDHGTFVDYTRGSVSYQEFVNRELILFSNADNERSIPHMMDGLKPSQRKILFACFKRNLRSEIKVAQLAGYVSEHSAYHHGEASLTQSIVGMAQNFVGSNNINLLTPCGQFGTRLMGGKDAASPRYIFTKLEDITRYIFHPDDDHVLDYLNDDGQSIEPTFYCPIIPMVLVNGSDGIGTGWSSSVPTYNPRELVDFLRKRLVKAMNSSSENNVMEEDEHEVVEKPLEPWFRGFNGDIRDKGGRDAGNFSIFGNAEKVNDSTIIINELPIRKWTTDYKHMLESMLIGGGGGEDGKALQIVKDFKENHTDTSVMFTVTMPPEKLAECLAEKGSIFKKFKLEGSVATSNMNLFDISGHIQKYDNTNEILNSFYDVRLEYYEKRKQFLLKRLGEEYERLDNKVRFITAVVDGDVVVNNRKKAELLNELKSKGYTLFAKTKTTANKDDDNEVDDDSALGAGYDYLLSMKLWNLTMEKVQALTADRDGKKAELQELLSTTCEQLWLNDLTSLEVALDDFEAALDEEKVAEANARKKANKAAGKSKGRSKKANNSDSEDDFEDHYDDEDFSDEEYGKKPKKSKPKAKGKAPPKEVKIVSEPIEKPDYKPVMARAKKEKVVKATSNTSTVDLTKNNKEDEEDMNENMDLMSRLMARVKVTNDSTSTDSILKKAPLATVQEDGDDDVDDLAAIPLPVPPKTKRAATKKKPIVVDSDSEGDLSLDNACDDSEDEFVVSKPAPKSKAKSVTKPKASTKTTKATTKSKVTTKPSATKKAAPSKNKSKKSITSDDEDDELDDYESDVEPVAAPISKTPKATRARKTTNYATYFDEDEEDDLVVDDESDISMDEEEDDDESDFE